MGAPGTSWAYDREMRPLLALSLATLIAGLALGLLTLYIDGRIGAPLLFEVVIAVAALTAFTVTFISRK